MGKGDLNHKNCRKKLTLEVKLQILRRFKAGEKASFIAKTLNLAPTTVRTICNRDADKIRSATNLAFETNSKILTRIRGPLMMKMESLLLIWIEFQVQRRMPLSQTVIQEKAKSIFEDLVKKSPTNITTASNGTDTSSYSSNNVAAEKFEASRGWFNRFKNRANLHNVLMKGEAASADTVAADLYKREIISLIRDGSYCAKQIFNVDETGLFWKRLPTRTFISREEKSVPGYKTSKERLTLLLGGNADGSFKFKPFLIYNSQNPRAMKNCPKNKLPLHWRANKKAWMTAILFEDWVTNCCLPELKAYCSKENLDFKCMVLIDNAPGHPVYVNEISPKVKFIFLPPNTTSLIQPMDQGVISTFKAYYLRRTFRQLLSSTDTNDVTMKEFWKSYNILKAVDNISKSWDEVKHSCMNGVWRKLWPDCVRDNTLSSQVVVDDVPAVRLEIENLARNANFEGMEGIDIDELLNAEQNITNEDLLEMEMNNVRTREEGSLEEEEEAEERISVSKKISEAIKLINKALEIFAEVDPDPSESSKFTRTISTNLERYEKMYINNKPKPVQLTLENFFVQVEPSDIEDDSDSE